MNIFPAIFDWNGSGRIDPADIGVGIAAAGPREARDYGSGRKVALISCAKQKKPYPCRAGELYSASTLFSLSYAYAKRYADRVFILSAKHGLVDENEILEPYNETLNEKSAAERRAWSRRVLEQLERACDVRRDTFLILAGKHYYEYLLPCLPHAELPLGDLPLGKRIAFLQQTLACPPETPPRRSPAARPEKPREIPAGKREAALVFLPGDRVFHDVFGEGTVLSVRKMAVDSIVEVDFDSAGRRKLALMIASGHMKKAEASE